MDSAQLPSQVQAVPAALSLLLGGIYFASSQLTLPILYRQPTHVSLAIFAQLYHRGAATVVPLALVSAASSATLAYLVPARRVAFVAAGASTVATLAWTAVLMASMNSRLLGLAGEGEGRKDEKADPAEVELLLRRWKWMNNVRAGLASVGGLVGLWAVLE